MSAQRIGIFTIVFPDPRAINYENSKFSTLNNSLSFQYRILSNIQTLSTKGVDSTTDPYGILYVPDLHSDGCKDQEQQYVPANTTRMVNLPANKNYAFIAVAPWYSPQCMIEYFTAARQVPTTKAILVYQIGQGDAKPPVLNDASWNLQDGGAWQKSNTFPTYALSTITGQNIMYQLGQYSGNLTDVPDGDELSQIFDDTDYVRLWATVSTDSGPRLPSLWVFLVIVLSILIVAVTGTSISMHIIQRRRRNDLRRRVIAGEVDLEALGVKRLNVSQQTLDKLPIYTYPAAPGNPEKSESIAPAAAPGLHSTSAGSESVTLAISASSASWCQPTCPICLDDFEPNETQVRELPCHHIFHPDCIDTFLLRNSSLCPMCKQSVLPTGTCPVTITNMMVRRERHIIRTRARSDNSSNVEPDVHQSSPGVVSPQSPISASGLFGSLVRRIGGVVSGRRIFNAPERSPSRPYNIEMASNNTLPPPAPTVPSVAHVTTPEHTSPDTAAQSNTHGCTPSQNRREWARQRALNMLGRQAPASDVEEVETGPRWRRTLHKIFPGFR